MCVWTVTEPPSSDSHILAAMHVELGYLKVQARTHVQDYSTGTYIWGFIHNICEYTAVYDVTMQCKHLS